MLARAQIVQSLLSAVRAFGPMSVLGLNGSVFVRSNALDGTDSATRPRSATASRDRPPVAALCPVGGPPRLRPATWARLGETAAVGARCGNARPARHRGAAPAALSPHLMGIFEGTAATRFRKSQHACDYARQSLRPPRLWQSLAFVALKKAPCSAAFRRPQRSPLDCVGQKPSKPHRLGL